MNSHFAVNGFPTLLGPLASHLPMLHLWGWVVAAIEASIGIGLLTRKYRNLAVMVGVSMHCFILYTCTVVLDWNSVVWPWNVAMIAFLFTLFWKADFSFGDVVWRNGLAYQKIVRSPGVTRERNEHEQIEIYPGLPARLVQYGKKQKERDEGRDVDSRSSRYRN